MSKTLAPTQKQASFLEKWGIAPMLSRSSCSRVVEFIKNGNGAQIIEGNSLSGRAKTLLEAQNKYNGKKVRHKKHGREGTVRYIYPKNSREVMNYNGVMKEVHGKDLRVMSTNPFMVIVDWTSNEFKASAVSLGMLELV